MRKLTFLTVWSVLTIFHFSYAALPLTTDDTGIVDTGKYELELSFDNNKIDNSVKSSIVSISLKHGLTEKMDLGISFPYQIEPFHKKQLGNVSITLKFLLLRDIFALSINNDLGSSSYFLNGIFFYELPRVRVHFNFGYINDVQTSNGNVNYCCGIEYPILKIDLVGELLGNKEGIQDYLFGLRYRIIEMYFICLSYGNSFKNDNEKISLGLHLEF